MQKPDDQNRWLPGKLEAQGCKGKIPYATGTEAARAKRRMKRRRSHGAVTIEIYRCRFCIAFHLGHSKVKSLTRSRQLHMPASEVTWGQESDYNNPRHR